MHQAPDSLLPRLRRPLTVGGLLDESILVFREHWISLAIASAVALVPIALVALVLSWRGMLAYTSLFDPDATTSFSNNEIAGVLVLGAVSIVATLIWTAAMVTASYALFRGRMPDLAELYLVALKRAGPLLLSILLVALASMVLAAAATALFVVTLFGTLGSLAALIGLVYWWRVPRGRTPVLKWLIILTAPYGLLVYYLTRWSLTVLASVVEQRGPIDALMRSAGLVSGQWFRTGAVLAVLSAILFVVGTMPAYIVILLFELLGLAGSPFAPSLVRAFVTNVVSILVQIPVGAIAFLGYTLLFVDLRNRREGTDLAERITALEAATRSAQSAA
jgi:hypothetical protein